VLVVLGVSAILFFTELLPLAVTAMLVPISLNLSGVISGKEAFENFGDQWVVLFMAMFVVGEGMFRTGIADIVGRVVVKVSGNSRAKLVVITMVAVGSMSAFLSNTGTVALFIPLVVGMAASAKLKPGTLLMPMAFAASLGGTVTLVGTPPNGVVNSAIGKAVQDGTLVGDHVARFGFFEFAKIGVIMLVVGVVYYALIGHRFLPDSEGPEVAEHEHAFKRRRNRMPFAVAIFVGVVAVMVVNSEAFPLQTAAMLGACLMVITGCVTMKEAFASISWTTIFLFAGMLSMSTAMSSSGAAKLVADSVVGMVNSPLVLLAAVFGITALVTNFMSNTATATLMAPLGVAMANKMGISCMPVLMGVAIASSCCFLTPVATPPNTMVLGPGGYRFWDYFKAGWPLQVISFVVGVLLIPVFWPF
jgi:anion transporter